MTGKILYRPTMFTLYPEAGLIILNSVHDEMGIEFQVTVLQGYIVVSVANLVISAAVHE